MTCQAQDTESLSAVELIAEHGLEGLPNALAALINEAMRLERERHLGAGPYERSNERCGYANGYKPRTMKTRLGALDLRGRHVALFGTGDQIGYPDTFVDAIGVMADTFSGTGARLVGRWPAGEYDIVASRALVGGEELLGLALDEDNEPDLTQRRVASWVAQVAAEAGLRDRVSI